MANWSELNIDLVGEIAKKIGTMQNFVMFSSVCRSWRSAAVKENWVPSPQFPWLALAEKRIEVSETKSNHSRRGFFSFNKKKRYDLDIPQPGVCQSYGSSVGWIVTINMSLKIHIHNPLTGVKLSLPHLHTFKHITKNGKREEIPCPNYLPPTHPDYIEPEWLMSNYIIKPIVFERNKQIFVAVVYGEFSYFAIARPGDESWSVIEHNEEEELSFLDDIAYCNGQLFVVTFAGELTLCEFDDGLEVTRWVTIVPRNIENIQYGDRTYLVESMGDLLIVSRWVEYNDEDDDSQVPYYTSGFDIHKLDIENKKWLELKSLGDIALFLGDCSSMSLSSANVGCEGNVIYFTDENHRYIRFLENRPVGNDIGIFSLEEKVIRPLIADNLESDDLCGVVSCPFWMIPSLF